jgi:diguanylate cyclase (GGDEF)-like protein
MIWMCVLGVAVGLVFPPFAVLLGVETSTAFTPVFFGACVAAGVTLGLMSGSVAKAVVGAQLARLADKMVTVRDRLMESVRTGEMSGCDPEECRVEIDSADEIGACADAYNSLVEALAASTELRTEIAALTDSLARHLDVAPLARDALNHLTVTGPFHGGAVLVVRQDEVELVAATGIADASGLSALDSVRRAVERGEVTRVEIPEDVRVDAGVVEFRPAAMIVLPLVVSAVPFGALLIVAGSLPTDAQCRLAEAASANLSLALKNALAHSELERLAALDGLTGVYNRRFGVERLREEFARSVRSDAPIGVAMIDLDHFKAVNDTYGHLVGDRVLRRVAEAVQKDLREGDSLIRYGGEEFLAILPGASVRDAAGIAERIRRRCGDLAIEADGSEVKATVSIGVAGHPDVSVDGPEALVHAADEALYEAKSAGRDIVVVAGHLAAPLVR